MFLRQDGLKCCWQPSFGTKGETHPGHPHTLIQPWGFMVCRGRADAHHDRGLNSRLGRSSPPKQAENTTPVGHRTLSVVHGAATSRDSHTRDSGQHATYLVMLPLRATIPTASRPISRASVVYHRRNNRWHTARGRLKQSMKVRGGAHLPANTPRHIARTRHVGGIESKRSHS
jgi:hypothetical protein